MARGGVRVQILSEFDPKGFEQARKSAEGFSGQMRDLAKTVGAAFATREVVNFAKSAVSAASDLGESINAVNVTFGEASTGILALGENAATAVGLSAREFNAFAVQFSGFTQQIAGAGGDIVAVTDDLTTRIADFASVMNMDVPEAAQVFQSALAGETEPIRRFGIDMSAAAVEAHALATGLVSSKSEMTEAIKVQARYSLLMQSTNKVAGDFANTSDSLANRQRILAASLDDAKATIGQAMIPALEAVLNIMTPLLDAFTALPEEMQGLIATTALLAVGMRSASTTLQGFGIAAGVANTTMGLLGLAIYSGTTLLNAYNTQKQEATRISEGFRQALDSEAEGVDNATDAFTINELTTGRLGEAIEDLGLNVRDVSRFIRGESVPALEEFFDNQNLLAEGTNRARAALDEMGASAEANAADVEIAAREIRKLRDGFETASTEADRFDDAMQDANDAVNNGVIAATHYAESMRVTQESLQRVKDAIDEVNEARQAEQDALFGTIAGLVQAGEAAGYSTAQTRELVAALGYLDGLSVEAQIELGLVSDVEQALITIDAMILTIQAGVRAMGGDARDVVASTRELVELRNELRRIANEPATSGGGGGGGGGGFVPLPEVEEVENEFDRFAEQVVSYGNRVLSDDFAEALFAGSAESIADTFDSVMMELAALAEGTVDASFDGLINSLSHKFREMVELANLRDELRSQLDGIREVQRAAEGLFTTGLEAQGDDGLSLRQQLQQRVQQARNFGHYVSKLQGMGFPPAVIRDVVNAGLIDGAAMAAELSQFDPSEVASFSAQVSELETLRQQTGQIVGGLLGAPEVQQALNETDIAMRDLTEAIQTDLANGINMFLSGLGAEVDRLTNPTTNPYIQTPGQYVRESINVTVNAGLGADGIQIGKEIVEILNEYSASGGVRLSGLLAG